MTRAPPEAFKRLGVRPGLKKGPETPFPIKRQSPAAFILTETAACPTHITSSSSGPTSLPLVPTQRGTVIAGCPRQPAGNSYHLLLSYHLYSHTAFIRVP